jgi:glycosyltransferase involved in cell wall biosynthesis
MKTLSIIIPVYNEAKTIHQVLKKVYAQRLTGWKKEIIVVNDGSTDETRNLLRTWEKSVTVINKQRNEGKGSAVSLGIQKTTGNFILIQDADSEYDPADYPALLKPFSNPDVFVVYGSRFLGPHLSTMFIYAQGNKFVTMITNLFYNTNITDMETGYKVFRKKVISGITIRSKRFDVEPELTVKILKRGYQIYEVPISYYGRTFREGKKLTWRDGVIALWTLIMYRFID